MKLELDDRRSDPSANVILLVGNATKYLEDLHKQSQEYLCQRLDLIVESSRREREAESNRIDSRWAVDNEAIRVANQTAAKQAEVLATQMAENAETLRASMAKTAETLALQLQQVTNTLDNRIKVVEQKQYESAGSSQGKGAMWGWVAGGIFLIITIISTGIAIVNAVKT